MRLLPTIIRCKMKVGFLRTRSAERLAIKNAYVAQHELRVRIAPLVIQDVKETLQKKFSDKDESELSMRMMLLGF